MSDAVVKTPLGMCDPQSSVCLHPMSDSNDTLRSEASDDDSNICDPVTEMGVPHEVPGSWLQSDPLPAYRTFGEQNSGQKICVSFVSDSPSFLSLCLSNENKYRKNILKFMHIGSLHNNKMKNAYYEKLCIGFKQDNMVGASLFNN